MLYDRVMERLCFFIGTIWNGIMKIYAYRRNYSFYFIDMQKEKEMDNKKNMSVLLGAAFLMATSAIGPGFLTQTATFTGSWDQHLVLLFWYR